MFLGGPPLVKMATGEEADDESLGGAEMHARVSGLADYFAADELDALRHRPPDRRPAQLAQARPGARPRRRAAAVRRGGAARHRARRTCKMPFDPREVIARIVDGSDFDEFKPLLRARAWSPAGPRSTATRSASSPTRSGVLFSEESQKAAQFIQLANQTRHPAAVPAQHHRLHGRQGVRAGRHHQARRDDDQRGVQQPGAAPTVLMGASYGAGNYGMCGRAYDPRFLFAWPSAKSAVMGPQQLAGVLSIVARQAAAAPRAGLRRGARRARCGRWSRSRSRRSRCRCSCPGGCTTTA